MDDLGVPVFRKHPYTVSGICNVYLFVTVPVANWIVLRHLLQQARTNQKLSWSSFNSFHLSMAKKGNAKSIVPL